MKKIAALAGLVLATGLMVSAPQAEAVSISQAAQRIQTAVNKLTTTIQTKITEIQQLQESGQYVAERMDAAEEILMETNSALLTAEQKVLYLYVGGVQEKQVMRLTAQSINSVVRARYEAVKAIDTQLGNSEITADEAEDLLNTQLNLTEEQLTQYKDTFKANIQEFMQLKANATRSYLDTNLNLATTAVASYGTLGYDTTRAQELLTEAKTYYNDANVLYADSKDGADSTDIKNMQKAAVKYIKARTTLSKVQVRIKAWENDWTAANPAPTATPTPTPTPTPVE